MLRIKEQNTLEENTNTTSENLITFVSENKEEQITYLVLKENTNTTLCHRCFYWHTLLAQSKYSEVCSTEYHQWNTESEQIKDLLWAMSFKDEDRLNITRLTSRQIEQVTCAVCCKYYIAPKTASCGHTLCHTCWQGRQKCAFCAKQIERHSLKHNSVIQNLTENVCALGEAFEKLFKIKVAEFLMEVESENDSTKNVRDWLASSQNHFSAPPQSSERSSHEMALPTPLNISSNKIQIHTSTSKAKSPCKIVCVPNIPQEDWDKIEPMPDTEDIRKDKENVVGPMDIEPFYIDDDNEYTVNNPRRSSRKRELKPDSKNKNNENKSLEKQNSKNISEEIDKKSTKGKQHWINVKRMRKEFSKLNKQNRGKLNVSIEMCKKTQSTAKTFDIFPQAATFHYDIDENTPDNIHSKDISKDHNINLDDKNTKSENQNTTTPNCNQGTVQDKNNSKEKQDETQEAKDETVHTSHHASTEAHVQSKNTNKLPFYKMSSLHPKGIEENPNVTIGANNTTHHNIVVDSNTNTNDDIEITIKVANTIANIVIKRKNDVEFKMNTDRQIQTSLDPLDKKETNNEPKNNQASDQNIWINVGDTHDIQVSHQAISNPRVDELKNVVVSNKTASEKKNTDSADTVSAQYEITESVEKELSKIMDFEEVDKQNQYKSSTTIGKEKSSKDDKSQKSAAPKQKPGDLEYLNDLDIFDSESIKESDVQLLKNTEHAPSEILLCTVKTKNKTQNVTEKRRKSTSDENILPKSKKAKINRDTSKSKQNQPEGESMNYDTIMGTVFANIDADMEEIRQSQNVKNTYTLNDNNKEIQQENSTANDKDKGAHEVTLPRTFNISNSSQIINNQKDSENVFSLGVEKENENAEIAQLATNKKIPVNVPPSNIEDFLTPVLSQAADPDVQMMNDDSDKSVVEETPQKTSFTKIKQKGNGDNKEGNQSQMIEGSDRVAIQKKSSETANNNSIVNLTDTSEIKSDVNDTAIKIDKKATETPLTINKFVDHICHNSTPLAKKNLNFDSEIVDDLTLCPTTDAVAKTTQEREFMIKAFEKTPTAPVVKPQSLRSLALKHKKCVIAGSCLTSAENANLRKLCARNKWSFVDKYTQDLTHLVVGVDEENKAQRSVKYMCALASSIWIVSYEWVKKSMQSKDLVYEEPYEALDSTGHPGPMRSRIASKKLFQGISFFCLEPFSVLDVDTLKGMIESSGGRVVEDAKDVRVNDKTTAPALLLAEPENTQEDRFTYLAMQLSIVPVNYEWVLNCLGSYTLASIQELLLCPAALLPRAVETWPHDLLARDEDDE